MQENDDLLASAYDYALPEELIADRPTEQRDASRLFVVPRDPAAPSLHRRFSDLPEFLHPGDVLVFNDSRVLPARLFGRREPGGGQCEILLLDPAGTETEWRAMCRPAKKLRTGTRIAIAPDFSAVVQREEDDGTRLLSFETGEGMMDALQRHGHMPLPPYILGRRGEKQSRPEDRERYQTVYAREDGSVAAPTAGLHFTPELLDRIRARGVETHRVTLHVGAGTFRPISTERIDEHAMHREWFRVPPETAEAIDAARAQGRRIVAVGTTTVRTLESACDEQGRVRPGDASTALMLHPGNRLRVVDALITNFHLPRSTLLCLVAAIVGRKRLLSLYEEAIGEQYRFYSYGDAMFLEGSPPGETVS